MRLILLFGSVSQKANIVVDIKTEQGSRLSPSLVDYEVIKGIMLSWLMSVSRESGHNLAYMWYDEVLLKMRQHKCIWGGLLNVL